MHNRVVTYSECQFNFCLLFIWLSNITPRPSRQPEVMGTHNTCEISGWLHVEIFQGAVPRIYQIDSRGCADPSIKGNESRLEGGE
jgi:hypothetical protein